LMPRSDSLRFDENTDLRAYDAIRRRELRQIRNRGREHYGFAATRETLSLDTPRLAATRPTESVRTSTPLDARRDEPVEFTIEHVGGATDLELCAQVFHHLVGRHH